MKHVARFKATATRFLQVSSGVSQGRTQPVATPAHPAHSASKPAFAGQQPSALQQPSLAKGVRGRGSNAGSWWELTRPRSWQCLGRWGPACLPARASTHPAQLKWLIYHPPFNLVSFKAQQEPLGTSLPVFEPSPKALVGVLDSLASAHLHPSAEMGLDREVSHSSSSHCLNL